jgi:hypothetical protein
MIRPLDNQERVNPPEYADRVAKLERGQDSEPRDFALRIKEAVREREEKEGQKQPKQDETPQEDSIELSSDQKESKPEYPEESPVPNPKRDSIDLVV